MRGHTLNKPTFAMNPLSTQVKSLIRRVIAQIPEAEEPHAVGGFLRDSLLGRPTNDLDITVRGDAMEVARRLAGEMGGSYVALDQPHQIARVVLQSEGEWRIDLASLQGDREQDLSRRDFTIDAMTTPLSGLLEEGWTESVLDPFNGREDVSNGVIRAVGRQHLPRGRYTSAAGGTSAGFPGIRH